MMDRDMLERRDQILRWMEAQQRPILLSELRAALGPSLVDETFEGLRRDGVIKAVFPEAKLGDSGRQFWDFTYLMAA